MKVLHLLRHAKSDWTQPGPGQPALHDHDRPLARRGRDAARDMATHVRATGLRPGLVLCSTALRARETLALVRVGLPPGTKAVEEDDLYLCGGAALLERIRNAPDEVGELLVVGHNPDLEQLAGSLAGTGDPALLQTLRDKYPTGALATIALPINQWADTRPGIGRLTAFVRPHDLKGDVAGAED
ncbi:MAG TPA: histidine phosphatase family protein [Azospirillaceae bacterium]|nr:histidine phosphatase family protein [Azospirillaceae bacterium]